MNNLKNTIQVVSCSFTTDFLQSYDSIHNYFDLKLFSVFIEFHLMNIMSTNELYCGEELSLEYRI